MASLPTFNTKDLVVTQIQSTWPSILNPLIRRPTNNSNILEDVALAIGSNTINHLLGRKLQGWKIVRQRAAASIYDTQDSNQQPETTLVLVSSAAVVCNIEVF